MNRWLALILYMIATTRMLVGPTPAIHPTQSTPQPVIAGGEDLEPPGDEISPEQEQAMWEDIQRNLATLRRMGALAAPTAETLTYNFPLRMAPGLPDYAGFR